MIKQRSCQNDFKSPTSIKDHRSSHLRSEWLTHYQQEEIKKYMIIATGHYDHCYESLRTKSAFKKSSYNHTNQQQNSTKLE